ncbi:MAG: TAT-variant-translocated molybdopterin oxidoreductase, partial [Verrucomicrobiota bacterium]
MKRKWEHPEESDQDPQWARRSYWRSSEELEDTPEFREWLEQEFPRGASEVTGEEATEESRRSFMKLMGASVSLAGFGLASCRRPDQYLVSANDHSELVPGEPEYYSSAFDTPHGGIPLTVTTNDGRPTLLAVNRKHPGGWLGLGSHAQASILELYDPDRTKHVLRSGEQSSWEAFTEEVLPKLTAGGGEGTAILLGGSSSPSRASLVKRVQSALPKLQIFQYEPLLSESAINSSQTMYGPGGGTVPHVDRADVILSLDCDFLGLEEIGEGTPAKWASRRKPEGKMSRLYSVEPCFTPTGGMADHRLRLPSSQIVKVAVLLAERCGLSSEVASWKAKIGLAEELINMAWIDGVVEDLLAHKGKALVVAGARQPESVHLLVGLINHALNAFEGGRPVLEVKRGGEKGLPGMAAFSKALKSGIRHVVSLTPADPLFDAPANLHLEEALAQVELLVHAGLRPGATGNVSQWHLPMAHFLEAWGDTVSPSGVYSVVQPMVQPFFGGKSDLEFLGMLLPAEGAADESEAKGFSAYEEVRETAKGRVSGDFEKAWRLG